MRKILFYTPYLDILGGGEQYLLSIASCLQKNSQITFVSKNPKTLLKTGKRFNINTKPFDITPFLPSRSQQKKYSHIFFVSDGSVPFLPYTNSTLLFMSPFRNVNGHSLSNQLKLKLINHVLCFSNYTKKYIDQEFKVNSQVIYPAIPTPNISSPKKNLILSVGRFSSTLHDKNQAALIKAFIAIEQKLPNWKLILAGGTERGSQPILKKLTQQIKGHNIQIKTDINRNSLQKLYATAKIYWHASGYEADLNAHPQKAEHFGITIVEAMSHGTVPLVFNAGGPTETVTQNSGLKWNSLNQLQTHTLKLINHPSKLNSFAKNAKTRAKDFNQEKFCKQVSTLFSQ